ncbi:MULTISPECIES: hypothetical protein [unclassified Haloparvum]|uniref:hypothetical protein n=1 Tax=Haloparvum sp. PAK95 TaxID=3418962 RepID=UPI003D2F0384
MRNHLRLLAGAVGVLYVLAPRQTIALLTRLAYRGGADVEPREWVYDAARIEGAVLTVLALRSLFRAAEADGVAEADDSEDADVVASRSGASESDEA